MKKLSLFALLLALFVSVAASAHAACLAAPGYPAPQPTDPQNPDGPSTDRRGPIDPFPPPTLWIVSLQ